MPYCGVRRSFGITKPLSSRLPSIFSGSTQRAEPIFHPAALSLAYVEQLHHACDALLDKKWASAARSY